MEFGAKPVIPPTDLKNQFLQKPYDIALISKINGRTPAPIGFSLFSIYA
jgi:hypothetical protein